MMFASSVSSFTSIGAAVLGLGLLDGELRFLLLLLLDLFHHIVQHFLGHVGLSNETLHRRQGHVLDFHGRGIWQLAAASLTCIRPCICRSLLTCHVIGLRHFCTSLQLTR